MLIDLQTVPPLNILSLCGQKRFNGLEFAALCKVIRIKPAEMVCNQMSVLPRA